MERGGHKSERAEFYYGFDFVEEFVDLWKLSDYKMTLTGSFIQDRIDYPGFWDHDVLVYLALYGPHEDKANEMAKKLAEARAKDG